MSLSERFSDRKYAAPFGRFEASAEAETPADEVLIGREGQRAYFVDILLRAGRKGAFLVTGHRGVGKSSFVYYCLQEYKREVFDRFLRSNVGRTLFWDRTLVLLLLFAAPLLLLMLSQLMELLTLAALKGGEGKETSPPSLLIWVVIVPLVIVCVYPLLYGWEVLSVLFRTRLPALNDSCRSVTKGRLDRLRSVFTRLRRLWTPSLKALSCTAVSLVLFWTLRPFGAPALSLSRSFCALCGVYLWVRCSSFQAPRMLTPEERAEVPPQRLDLFDRREVWCLRWHKAVSSPIVFAVVGFLPFAMGVVSLRWIPSFSKLEFFTRAVEPSKSFWGNLSIGFILLGAGAVFQGFHQLRWDTSEKQVVRGNGARIYISGGLLVATIAFLVLGSSDPFTFWFSLTVCILAGSFFLLIRGGYARWWRKRVEHSLAFGSEGPTDPMFRPRPHLALLLKAAISFVVGLHLVYPVARPLVSKLARPPLLAETLCRGAGTLDQFVGNQRCVELPGPFLSVPLRCPVPLWRVEANNSPFFALKSPSGVSWTPPSWKPEECVPADRLNGGQVALTNYEGLFRGRREEIHWVFAVFLILLVLYFLDYEWILRPFLPGRRDPAIDPRGFEDQVIKPVHGMEKDGLRHLAGTTLPWTLYDSWLPMITVSVNLGFEGLDHRRVIQAMLVGLREQYRRTFVAWNSGIANLGRMVAFTFLLALVTLAGQRWFALSGIENHEEGRLRETVVQRYRGVCSMFEGAQSGPSAVHLICGLKWGDEIFHALFFNLVETNVDTGFEEERNHLLFLLFPYQSTDWPSEEDRSQWGPTMQPLVHRGMHFRIYHLLLFLLFYFLGRTILRRIPLFPYRDILRKIDLVLENLTGSTSSTSRFGRWPMTKWVEGFTLGEQVRQIQHEPFDPRTIEFEFLQVLHEIQQAAIDLPGARSQRISLPVPEVTFFFDELDKLGTRVEPAAEGASEPQQAEILNAERRRSMELHKLLADMKNVLSVAPARFIFVGGRNLHDEWLADQTSRLPLLTSIFQSEVYLPSLLTDRDRQHRDDPERLPERIEQFLAAQRDRAQRQFESYHSKLFVPSFGLRHEERSVESFVDPEKYKRADGRGTLLAESLKIWKLDGEEIRGQAELLRDFLQFMTYRSLGNPKRLRELLAWFVRPVGRYVGRRDLREMKFCCDHILLLDEVERFRIQLLARIYRHINFTFDQGFSRRDDKMTVSVFYLSDFLFKFHRRAFSWSSLERVEDMVQIHRAPDLREVMETMVEQWAERFLHRIRNGMYDFRFRSELAREVEYISRHSPAEMAAFNFTLDESRALKSIYETTIRRLKDGSGRELQDFVSGLGELHEFDQEYETARVHYRHAISLIDGELRAITGGSELLEKASPMMQVLTGWSPGPEYARRYLTWGIARLRLMLQVGMTFELARNHERASVEYSNAANLARALLLSLLDDEGRLLAQEAEISRCDLNRGEDRLDVLKHLNLLFQPTFAGAWVAEKLIGAVDTSTALVDATLSELRTMLPFVREPKVKRAEGPVEVRHSNFSLITAELHNKAGDLYFLKGSQLTSRQAVKEFAKQRDDKARRGPEDGNPRHGQEGYLLQAHYHYAVGLHELRRFTAYRRESSATKFNIKAFAAFPGEERTRTLEPQGWPDFVYRSLGGTLNDFAEVMLGRVSLYGVVRSLRDMELGSFTDHRPIEQRRSTEALVKACSDWMELLSDRPQSEEDKRSVEYRILVPLGARVLDCGTLGGWFGRWNEDRSPDDRGARLVTFSEWLEHDDLERLAVALNLMLVGGKFLEKGGYVEDAAREFMKVAEIATSYLWWWWSILRLVQWRHGDPEKFDRSVLALDYTICTTDVVGHSFWNYLEEVAQFSLEKADQLFRRSRKAQITEIYQVGDKIPVACIVTACSLGLAAKMSEKHSGKKSKTIDRLKSLVGSWLGGEAGHFLGSQQLFEGLLKQTLERHSFPMLARLQGLKVLIDASVLSEPEPQHSGQVIGWAMELHDLARNFDAPLHFTPMHSGTTFALVYIYFGIVRESGNKNLETLRRAAQGELLRSEEMYTLRRAFYESIADLYYLYDDFNERQIHFNHALQMAASELVSVLRYRVSSPDFDRVHEVPLTIPEALVREPKQPAV